MKRGLSTIVTTLLILLLIFVAVGIIWVVVRNVIQEGAEQVNLGKFTLDLKISQVQTINDSAISIKIKRNPGAGDFIGLNFVIDDGDNSEVIKLEASLNELQEMTYILILVGINASNIKSIKIAPVFRLESGKEVIGPVKDEYEVSSSMGVSECQPNCPLNAECGSDGCGGSCGTCDSGYVCSNYVCVNQSSCNDTCSSLGYECGTVCGVDCGTCNLAHAVSSCSSGSCIISSCSSGYANCDNVSSNGCETQLGTNTNCASCGDNCSSGICVSGECVSCTSHDHIQCYNNDVYWYDSCNVREEIYDDCTSEENCISGECVEQGTELLAFPGAEGFAKYTRGAYAGSSTPAILIVDTLSPETYGNEATGRGTFSWALTRNYPRIVLFEVSGTIEYTSNTVCEDSITVDSASYLWVAGQSAPSPGITIKGHFLNILDSHDVIIQHIRIRPGDEPLSTNRDPSSACGVVGRDGIDTRGSASNVIIDHCSVSWTIDELLGCSGDTISWTNNLVAFPLRDGGHYHESSPPPHFPEVHMMGPYFSCTNNYFAKNIIAFSGDRSPLLSAGSHLIANNFMYVSYYQAGATMSGTNTISYVGNSVFPTHAWEGNSKSQYAGKIKEGTSDSGFTLYVDDNDCILKQQGSTDDWANINRHEYYTQATESPFDLSLHNIMSASEVQEYTLDNAGARPADRDTTDTKIIELIETRDPTIELIDSPSPLPARIYNTQSSSSAGSLVNGYDWSANPDTFVVTVNGAEDCTVNLNQACMQGGNASVNCALNMINSQLQSCSNNVEAFKVFADNKHYPGYYVGLRTKQTGASQSLTISKDVLSLGFFRDWNYGGGGVKNEDGTYYGYDGFPNSDGSFGYPNLAENTRPLTSVSGYPSSDPHGDDDSDGYSNLEEWIYQQSLIVEGYA